MNQHLRAIHCSIWMLLTVVSVSGCMPSRPELPEYSRVIAQAGPYEIKEDMLRFRFRLELNNFPQDFVDENRKKPMSSDNPLKQVFDEVLNKMIDDDCILAYGDKHGVTITDAELAMHFDKRKAQMTEKDLESILSSEEIPYPRWKKIKEDQIRVDFVLEKMLSDKLTVSYDEIESYYNKNKDAFKIGETAWIRHIVTDTEDKAKEILTRLNKGENFAQLAVNHSISPDRANGGDLGYIEKRTYPAVFDQAFNLKKGALSPIIKSEYGYHIFKLLDKKPAGVKSLEDVTATIHEKLFEDKLKNAYKDWISKVRQDIPVKIDDNNLKSFIL